MYGRTVLGSEFQTDGAEDRKAHLEQYVLVNGSTTSGQADERRDRPQARRRVMVRDGVTVSLRVSVLHCASGSSE